MLSPLALNLKQASRPSTERIKLARAWPERLISSGFGSVKAKLAMLSLIRSARTS